MSSFEAIVVGTGFGGAVAACRLVQAGKKICVLERGRRYESQPPDEVGNQTPWSDFPALPDPDDALPDPKRWRWADDQGLWDVRNLDEIFAVQAAGYGGGSLIYANVHLRAPKEVFATWPFDRQELDPYYDLVAYMLGVKPITEAPFPHPEKTDQFEKAADGLGRKDDFFYPPLAINFGEPNRFQRPQGVCNGCGECISGCHYGAKNTLDLNYLAVVDDSDLADVRTQAEATLISANQHGYEVEYRDHLRGGKTCFVSAPSVFLCAGAINSTELLLRSRKRGLPKLKDKALGQQYFPNADFIGMIYEAETPAKEPRRLMPTRGPTITASLYHERLADHDATRRRHWFLMEEGGFPIEIAHHLGLLRAPLLLRRNRFDDRMLRKNEIRPVAGAASTATARRPPNAERDLLRSLAEGLYAILENESEILERIAPAQLKGVLAELQREFAGIREKHLESAISKVREKLMSRGLLRWVPDCLAPSAKRIREDTEAVLREDYGLGGTPKQQLALATKLASWLLQFHDTRGVHSENAMVLLAMGLDSSSGTIELRNKQLRVDLGPRSDAPVYTLEECLMRDLACALGGKLRVNPLWSFARTPMTVHSQGGCPMSTKHRPGVTDHDGQVHDYPGLFVLDAAAFPAPAGVNPSATIAAVAERNIALALDRQPTDDMRRAAEWWRRQTWTDHQRVRLEPPRHGASPAFVNRPVGIEFTEKMSGFHYLMQPAPQGGKNDDARYESAEVAGREIGNFLSVELRATIEDVAAFIRSPRHLVDMTGTLHLVWQEEGIRRSTRFDHVSGTLDLFDCDASIDERTMRYDLRFGGPPQAEYTLTGYKRIHDDPGPDAWRDTSSLFTRLRNPKSGLESYGVIHIALDGFLFDQLPSFTVTNTDDPARIAWALSSFGAYFFGHLQRIYLPQLGRIVEGFSKLEIR